MMTFVQISRTFGDCTAVYDVLLDREYTVRELINEILTRNEWGEIGVLQGAKRNLFDDPHCEYRYSELLSTLPDEYLNALSRRIVNNCRTDDALPQHVRSGVIS